MSNSSENGTLSNNDLDIVSLELSPASLVFGLMGATLSILTVTENSVILFVIGRTPSLRTSSNALICSLAIADFLIGAVSMNVYTLYTVMNYFPFGKTLCKVYIWIDFTVWSSSLSSLAMVMLDRYLSLQINSRYKDPSNQSKYIVIMLCYIWCTSGTIWLWGVLEFEPEVGRCYFLPRRGSPHMIVSSIVTVYSPLIIITSLCYAISLIVKSHSKRAKRRLLVSITTANGVANGSRGTRNNSLIPLSGDDSKQISRTIRRERSPSTILGLTCQRILNRERKALRLLLAFVISFYLCITPYYITYVFLAVAPNKTPKWLLPLSYWSGYFNSTVNPILYNIFNDDFRNALMDAFTFRKRASFNIPPTGNPRNVTLHNARRATIAVSAIHLKKGTHSDIGHLGTIMERESEIEPRPNECADETNKKTRFDFLTVPSPNKNPLCRKATTRRLSSPVVLTNC